MMRSMFAGVTGLRNHQIRMDAIGNNIANVNTVGYKASRVSFQDTLNQTLRGASAPNANRGGINALQVGLGMNLASIDVLHTQGNLQNTGKITDCAIQGDGFFILSDGNRQYYTRAGNFNMERDGRLVNPSNGLMVRGWMADINGNINTNIPITNIRIPVGQTIAPIATTQIEFGGNLASNTNIQLEYEQLNVSDAEGNSCTITFEINEVGFNEYEYRAIVPSQFGSITSGSGTGRITLNEYGVVMNTGTAFEVTPASGTEPIIIEPPQVNRRLGGGFTAHPTGTLQEFDFAGFTGVIAAPPPVYNRTVRDTQGNPINLSYEITETGVPDQYRWTLTAGANTAIVSGVTGTFTWTAANGITEAEQVATVVHFDNGTVTGPNITINPPNLMGGAPTFTVVERAPDILTIADGTAPVALAPPAVPATPGEESSFDLPIQNLNGEVISVLHFRLIATTPPDEFNYTITLGDDGSIINGGSGTIQWDAAGGTHDFAPDGGGSLQIRTEDGILITIPPIGAVAIGAGDPPTFENVILVGGEQTSVTIEVPEPVTTMTRVYDSLGQDHVFITEAIKIGDNTWRWRTIDENEFPIGNGTLSFSSEGQFIGASGGTLTYDPQNGALPMEITPDFSVLTQYAGTLDSDGLAISDFNSPFQDGYPMGMLQGFNIDKSGRIVGVFSNGMNQNLGQLAIASFTNPAGLTRVGDTMFEESSNSGQPQIGQAGQGSRGQITPGTVEMSNVDLSQEFTDMIMTERGFQSNSRVITTSDEMLQELVNLKR
ncbi:MAG: flagellar hook-basal body complex protein [Bacteroidota bacterium]